MKTIIASFAAAIGLTAVIASIATLPLLARLALLIIPSTIAGFLAMSLAQKANLDPALVNALACFVSVLVTCVQGWLIKRAASVLALLVNGASMVACLFFFGVYFVSAPQIVDPTVEAWFHRDGSPRLFTTHLSADAEFYDRSGYAASGKKLIPVTSELRIAWLHTGKLPRNLQPTTPQPEPQSEPVKRRTSQLTQPPTSLGEQCKSTNPAANAKSQVVSAPPSDAATLSPAPGASAKSAVDELLDARRERDYADARFCLVARELLHTAFANRVEELERLKDRSNRSAEELYRRAAAASGWKSESSLSAEAAVNRLLDQQRDRDYAAARFSLVARELLQTAFARREADLENIKKAANGDAERLLQLSRRAQ